MKVLTVDEEMLVSGGGFGGDATNMMRATEIISCTGDPPEGSTKPPTCEPDGEKMD